MKKLVGVFLTVVVTLITLEVILFLLGLTSYDEVAGFEWTDTCYGAEVDFLLTTDSPWVTRHTDPP